MAIPDVTVTFQDGALGVAPPNTNNVQLKIGPAALGIVNTMYSAADLPTLQRTLGNLGSLVESAAVSISDAGGPLWVCPVNPSTLGTVSAVTKVGAGAETMTAAVGPPVAAILRVVNAGAVGTSTLQLSTDGGVTYGAPFASAAGPAAIPGYSLCLVSMSGNAVSGDTYSIPVNNGSVVHTGGGALAITVSSSSCVDSYSVVCTITVAGALGTAQFTYSLDGGNTVSANNLIPGTGVFAIPNTGIVVTFVGTSTVGDYFTFTSAAPAFSGSDVTTALNACVATVNQFFLAHIVGAPASSAAGNTLLATLDGLMTSAANGYRFARCVMENPQDTDANIVSAYASASSLRVGVGAGFYQQISPINGTKLNRNVAWKATARLARISPGEDPSRVASGSLPGVPGLVRDEALTPSLDAARFITMRSIIGRQGYYLTNYKNQAPNGSDYTYGVNGRVMDIYAASLRNALLQYLNDSVRTDPNTGFILEADARNIEGYIDGVTRAAVTQPGYASSVSQVVARNVNMLSTGQLQVTGRCVPLAYNRSISINVGFSNPALAQKSF